MVRMDSFSSVPPPIQPPMAQVPSAIRELIRCVPLISIYSIMLSFVLSPSLVSLATERAWRDVMAAGEVFQYIELRVGLLYAPLKNFNASLGRKADIACIVIYAARHGLNGPCLLHPLPCFRHS